MKMHTKQHVQKHVQIIIKSNENHNSNHIQSLAYFGNKSGVNFIAIAMFPLIFIFPYTLI